MKNLLTYYILILAPIGILVWLYNSGLVNQTLFVSLIFFYVIVYRTYTDGKRLADKNIIQKKDIWKMILPGSRFDYFKELYLK